MYTISIRKRFRKIAEFAKKVSRNTFVMMKGIITGGQTYISLAGYGPL